MPTSVPCPTCGRPVEWSPASPFRPFCSERCKLIDLGDWLDESHRISDLVDATCEDVPPADESPATH